MKTMEIEKTDDSFSINEESDGKKEDKVSQQEDQRLKKGGREIG